VGSPSWYESRGGHGRCGRARARRQGWTLLLFAGAQLVNHQLRHLSNLYGTFATILGLIWWIALGAMVTVYAAEVNVVLTRHLWPRSIRRGHPPGVEGPEATTGSDPPVARWRPGVDERPAVR